MTSTELNATAPYASGRELWLQCRTEAARQAVLDTYRWYLNELNGNETTAAELTRSWAAVVKRDFPGMPPEIYTVASLQRWADSQRRAFGEGV